MSAPLDLTRAPAHDPLEIYRFRDGLYAVDLIAAAIRNLTSSPSSPRSLPISPSSATTSARIAVRPT